jgi:lipopolysaccharide biosynthesis glycosyltransferase
MLSLCENNGDMDFHIYCIDAGISEENKQKMIQVTDRFQKTLTFVDFSDIQERLITELNLPACNGSYATYVKIFPEVVFPELDTILFMDGDTIIAGSLSELDRIDLNNYLFAAVRVPLINEKRLYKYPDPDNLRLQYALQFLDTGYYNIGVCLVNLKKWKELDFGSIILSKREEHVVRMSQSDDVPIDEMLFNLAAKEDVGMEYVLDIHPKFNCTAHNMPYPRAVISSIHCGYLDKREQKEAYFHPTVVHYCIFKPWYIDTYTKYRRLINHYIAESPWPHPHVETWYKTKHEKIFGKYIYVLPYDWMITLASRTYHTFLWLLSVFTNKIHRENKPPHFIRAIIRRSALLRGGNIKEAFTRSRRLVSPRDKHI